MYWGGWTGITSYKSAQKNYEKLNEFYARGDTDGICMKGKRKATFKQHPKNYLLFIWLTAHPFVEHSKKRKLKDLPTERDLNTKTFCDRNVSQMYMSSVHKIVRNGLFIVEYF